MSAPCGSEKAPGDSTQPDAKLGLTDSAPIRRPISGLGFQTPFPPFLLGRCQSIDQGGTVVFGWGSTVVFGWGRERQPGSNGNPIKDYMFGKSCLKSGIWTHLRENTMFFFICRNPAAVRRFVRYRSTFYPSSQCIALLRLVSSLRIMNQ